MELFLIMIIVVVFGSIEGGKPNKIHLRLRIMESKMDTMETRMSLDSSNIQDISDMIGQLNSTFQDHEAVCRNVNRQTSSSRTATTQVSDTDSVQNIEDTGYRVMAAFQQEKIKLRETVNKVNNNLVELRENSSKKADIDLDAIIDDYDELRNAMENINISLVEKQEEITSTLELLASELKQERQKQGELTSTVGALATELKQERQKQGELTSTVGALATELKQERQKQGELTITVGALATELKQDRMFNKRKSEPERNAVINEYNELKNAMKNINISLVEKIEIERNAAKDFYNELKNAVKNINISLIEKQEEITSTVKSLATEVTQTTTLISEKLTSLVTEQKDMRTTIGHISNTYVACPNLWSRFEIFCYRFFNTSSRANYTETQRRCADSGAYVVDIHSHAESEFVNDLARDTNGLYWIGLTDIEEEGTWKWDRTKSEASFTNWIPGQPGSRGGNQDCASAGWYSPLYGMWNDLDCTYNCPYVCKKSL